MDEEIIAEIWEMSHPFHTELILNHLGCDHTSEVNIDYEIFEELTKEEKEELWAIPEGVVKEVTLENVRVEGFTYGTIWLCNYKGKSLVIEQSASPLIVYYSKN